MEPPPLPPPPPLQVDRSIAPIGFPDPALEQVLRTHLFPPGSNPTACQRDGGLRYVYNRVDLDGDRTPETLVAVLKRQGCAKDGCPVVLLQDLGLKMRPLQTLLGFHSALIVAERQTGGWRDLILPQAGEAQGGWLTVRSHNGTGYPTLPPVHRAEALPTPTRGVTALEIKESPYLVQGHSLPCAPPEEGQRKRVFNKVPIALPRSSLLLEEEPPRPSI